MSIRCLLGFHDLLQFDGAVGRVPSAVCPRCQRTVPFALRRENVPVKPVRKRR